jgi:hypothetical protein
VTTKRRALIALAIAFACLLVAAGLGVKHFLAKEPGPPPEAPVIVPARWAELRTSPGHMGHVGKQGIECKSCHDYEKEGFKNPGIAPCARCHATETTVAHHGSATLPTDCLTCHVFAPDQKAPTCISCHAAGPGLVGLAGFDRLDAGAPIAPITTHATTECSTCHNPHRQPSGVSQACATCHEERAPSHAAHAGSNGCADCHAPHTPAAAALTVCASCHSKPAGPKPAGHESCLTCHSPHEFTADRATVCANCHGAKPTLAATTVPAHALCTSCHTPHDPGAAASSCTTCHANIQVSHGTKDACVNCHEAHPTDHALAATTKVNACTSCHANMARTDTGAHAGGVACTSCHKEHDFDPPRNDLALCSGCHTKQATLTATNPGHKACDSCHGGNAHAPIAKPTTCGSCHKVEQSTAPKGHQLCENCHEPHSGQHLAAATCESCHENKTKGPHHAVAGGCATCHRPHGSATVSLGPAAPPACSTCHNVKELPALHTIPAHSACATCHSSHDGPRSDRTTCTGSCHADRRTHQPQAQVCDGCHVFRR